VASKSLEEWLKILWENWRMSTWYAVCSCLCLSRMLLGVSPPPFIDQGGGGLHARRAI
jgi:hypothetical protein